MPPTPFATPKQTKFFLNYSQELVNAAVVETVNETINANAVVANRPRRNMVESSFLFYPQTNSLLLC
jgi:hypothetical protein